VGLNDRFLVVVGTNGDKDTLYKFVDAIDYKGIAALGPGPATAKPTTQPTSEPEEPSTEEESSETPGFELLAAVLGILATVALFVRRRG
jgi:PGF-CTERM protein